MNQPSEVYSPLDTVLVMDHLGQGAALPGPVSLSQTLLLKEGTS